MNNITDLIVEGTITAKDRAHGWNAILTSEGLTFTKFGNASAVLSSEAASDDDVEEAWVEGGGQSL